jgi:hypothetical protein
MVNATVPAGSPSAVTAAVEIEQRKTRIRSIVIVCTYQIVGLILNVMSFRAVPLDSTDARALSVHIVFRVLSIGAMVVALRASSQSSPAAAPPLTR